MYNGFLNEFDPQFLEQQPLALTYRQEFWKN